MFLLDPQSIIGQSPGPGDLASQWGGGGAGSSKASELVRLPWSEATTVQALMDLALPRFAGLGDGPRQIHKLWMVTADSPALSSSNDDAVGPVGLSDLSVTLLCGSDDDFTPVNSDQVLSDVDLLAR